MAIIVTRASKASPLTNSEIDANFENINNEVSSISVITNTNSSNIAAIDASRISVAGDIGGTTSAPLVIKLYGNSVSSSSPVTSNILLWNGIDWTPTSSISVSSTGYTLTLTQTGSGKALLLNGSLDLTGRINGVRVWQGLTLDLNCVAIGTGSLESNTIGDENTAIGPGTLSNNISGIKNIAIGAWSLGENISGDGNIAIGVDAGVANTIGNDNIFIGKSVGWNNLSGSENTIIGSTAGYYLTSGKENVALGFQALNGTNTGTSNVSIGYASLFANTAGYNNIALGKYAGKNITTGNTNITIGYDAASTLVFGTSNVIIGHNCNVTGSAARYQIVLGDNITGQGNNYFTFGNSGNRVYNQFDTAATWTRTSDERYKKNIKTDTLGLNFINNLRPVTYQWRPSNEIPEYLSDHKEENEKNTEVVMHGFIAQEVKQALDMVGINTFSGWHEGAEGVQGISYEMFIMPLVNAVKELSRKVEDLENIIKEK